MEGKDDRSKDKRSKMHNNKHKRHHQNAKQTTSSSSGPGPTRAGVIDVADSSDDRSIRHGGGGGWISATVPSQQRHYSMNPDLDFEDDEANAQLNAGDFDVMSQMPTAVGGTFQFASEKNWDNAEEMLDNTEASAYFTLNLKLLNVGLQTIPFYKRMDYASSMFTTEQLLTMDKAAEVAETTYQNVLRDHQTNPRIKINSGSKKSSAKSNRTGTASVQKESTATAADGGVPDELDELLSLTNSQMAKVSLETVIAEPPVAAVGNENLPPNTNKDDIQQWLDNVLDE